MEYVWVKPLEEDEFEIPFGAWVVERLKKHLRIKDDDGREHVVLKSAALGPMHPSCVEDVDDMIKMGDLQEYSILRNLQLRYKKDLIYTYTGHVLIAVNPYQFLPIYGQDVIKKYRNKKLGELPPHLFAIGDASYESMRNNKKKQCIIINGESGAGKTQSTQLLLQYYAAITGKHSDIEQQVLTSNTVLEAFGNAKTIRNDNSSRFGKYISINFNSRGKMERARIQNFLLEKSRIVSQCQGEMNYHVFYILLDGLSREEKRLLALKEVSFYRYLAQDVAAAVDKKRISEFQNFMKALKVLNFSDEIIWNIFQLLAAILHLGNVNYTEEFISGVQVLDVISSNELSQMSALLGVPSHYLKFCLTKKTVATTVEKVIKQLNRQEAISTRDAFVKAVYGNLFTYIVKKINETLDKRSFDTEGYIGVLDVFGFENLKSNSFEQLCINLANEYLQQFFIYHTFKVEQIEYGEEGIYWENINFTDNTSIIDMICVERMNVISIINDQSKFPNSTDESLLGKLIERHGENENFFTPKFNNIQAFGINHFAGVVLYDVKDFLDKNRDSCTADYMDLARLSENPLLQEIFSNDAESKQRGHVEPKKMSQSTSASKFKNSLNDLIRELYECHPFFVRCIKPNELQKPKFFDRQRCCQQLRYSGILETSKIRQAGYAIRYTYREFVLRYKFVKPSIPAVNHLSQDEFRQISRDICHTVFERHLDEQFGCTRVFLRNSEYLVLEKERAKILSYFAVVIQTRVRAWICRKRFTMPVKLKRRAYDQCLAPKLTYDCEKLILKKGLELKLRVAQREMERFLALRRAAIVMQKRWRGRSLKRDFLIRKNGILRLQALIRARYQRQSYLHLRQVINRFQARCKGYIVRRKCYQQLQARAGKREAVEIQAAEPEQTLYKPAWERNFRRGAPVKQDSYLHGRGARVGSPNLSEVSKFVDDSFEFLNDHASQNKTVNHTRF